MSHNSKVYRKQGGTELVVSSGGQITIESGGDIVHNGTSLIDEVAALSGLEAGEVAFLNGVTAGTAAADKAVVLTTGKVIDEIDITALKIGGSAVTSSAAELNLIDGSSAGSAVASKALVLGADKNVDTLVVADSGLKLGAGAGTAITKTAAQINALVGGVAGAYRVARGVHTTVAAADTVATGLTTVVAVVVSLGSDPTDDPFMVSATIGDQAGAPVAGSVIIKSWKHDGTDPTPSAAGTFTKLVNWIAVGT